MNSLEELKFGCYKPYNSKCEILSNDIKDCRQAGGSSMYDCVQMAGDKFVRSKDENKDQIYPWKNYDWDYTRFIDNNYSALNTGATSEGSMKAIFTNPRAIFRLGKGFLYDENPSSQSIAGRTDLTNCWRVPANDRNSCMKMMRMRKEYDNQPKPRNDPFFNKKLDGVNSSSFYYKSGYCKTNLSKNECINKKYKWLQPGDRCYKPQYQYLNNEPYYGNIPSVVNDTLSLNPKNLTDVFFNRSTSKRMPWNKRDLEIENCPDVVEKFINSEEIVSYFHIAFAILLLISLLLFIYFVYRI
jgi:hypothetical protein